MIRLTRSWIVYDTKLDRVHRECRQERVARKYENDARYRVTHGVVLEDRGGEDKDTHTHTPASPPPSSPSKEEEDTFTPPTTSSGTPCTRCVENQDYCWQHEP